MIINFKKCKRKDFFSNVAMIVKGTVLAQLITVLVSPILTRIYTPESYGVFSTFNSLIALLSISASLDYQNAIPLVSNDDDALHLLSLSIGILVSICTIIFLVLFLTGDWLLRIFNYLELSEYKYFLVAGIFFAGLYNIFMQNAYRNSAFKTIAKTKYTQCFFSNGIKIISGLIFKSPIGLILGVIVGQSAGTTSLAELTIPHLKTWKFSAKKSAELLIRYKKFPLFSAPNNYINALSVQMPVLILSIIYTSDIVGAFSLANSIVGLPALFIGTAIGQVFYAKISKKSSENLSDLKNECSKIIIQMAIGGGVIFFLIACFLPSMFVFIFGDGWKMAGIFSRYLSFNSLMSFIVIPIGRVLEIINQQQVNLIFNLVRFIALALMFIIIRVYNMQATSTILFYSIVSGFFYFMMIIVVLKEIDKKVVN